MLFLDVVNFNLVIIAALGIVGSKCRCFLAALAPFRVIFGILLLLFSLTPRSRLLSSPGPSCVGGESSVEAPRQPLAPALARAPPIPPARTVFIP